MKRIIHLLLITSFSIGAVKRCEPLEVVALFREMDTLIAEINPELKDPDLYHQENDFLKSLTEKQRQQYFTIQRKRAEALSGKK